MQVAIISDIHSNLEALTAVLRDVDERGIEQIWCLGDLVGYNADPDRCCEIIEKRCHFEIIMGNHDAAAAGLFEPYHFNSVAREAVLWTREVLKASNLDFLKRLKSAAVYDEEILLVHGSPSDPERYIFSGEIARDEIYFMVRNLGRRVCFFGHTHYPVAYELDGEEKFSIYLGEGTVELNRGSSYLVNPGSVGQPRDGDTRTSYTVFDSVEMTLEWVRLPYDIDLCQRKIIEAGLPRFLADRLGSGH